MPQKERNPRVRAGLRPTTTAAAVQIIDLDQSRQAARTVFLLNKGQKWATDTPLQLAMVRSSNAMNGSEAMQGKQRGSQPRAGAVQIVQPLQSYPEYLDHPGWKALKH